MYQYLRPRLTATSGLPTSPQWISCTTRNICLQARPPGQTKTHTVIGTHFLSFSVSQLLLTLCHGFAVGFITLQYPLEYYLRGKSPHLIQYIALGSRFSFPYWILVSKKGAYILPNLTSIPLQISPQLRAKKFPTCTHHLWRLGLEPGWRDAEISEHVLSHTPTEEKAVSQSHSNGYIQVFTALLLQAEWLQE